MFLMRERKLVYTGRGVDNPRDVSKMTVNNLDIVLEELTSGKPISVPVTNPIGCNIKVGRQRCPLDATRCM